MSAALMRTVTQHLTVAYELLCEIVLLPPVPERRHKQAVGLDAPVRLLIPFCVALGCAWAATRPRSAIAFNLPGSVVTAFACILLWLVCVALVVRKRPAQMRKYLALSVSVMVFWLAVQYIVCLFLLAVVGIDKPGLACGWAWALMTLLIVARFLVFTERRIHFFTHGVWILLACWATAFWSFR